MLLQRIPFWRANGVEMKHMFSSGYGSRELKRRFFQPSRILSREFNPLLIPPVQVLQLNAENRGLDFIQTGVIPDLFVIVLHPGTMVAQALEAKSEVFIR